MNMMRPPMQQMQPGRRVGKGGPGMMGMTGMGPMGGNPMGAGGMNMMRPPMQQMQPGMRPGGPAGVPQPPQQMQQQPQQQQQQQQGPGGPYGSGGPSQPLNAAALAAAPPSVQKQMIGEKLFPAISKYQPELAGKITGMMLEMDNSELLILLESEQQLKNKVDEALRVLDTAKN